jgi:hypothetical protein
MAQPLIRDDSNALKAALFDADKEKIHGTIERVDAEQIVVSFQMPDDYTGTPTVTVVAPGKAIDLNWLQLYVNGSREKTTLDRYPARMFGGEPPSSSIDGVEVFKNPRTHKLAALVDVTGPDASAEVFVNGVDLGTVGSLPFHSPSLLRFEFDPPSDEKIQITLAGEEVLKADPVPNPAFMKITAVSVITSEDHPRRPAVVVKIEGSGFSENLRPSIGDLTVVSSSEAILKIPNPGLSRTVTLTDPATNFSVKAVVTFKKPPK